MSDERFEVLPNDHGIRAKGDPDRCFFCGQKVGQFHEEDCVVIVRNVFFSVWLGRRMIGSYIYPYPSHWSVVHCQRSMNENPYGNPFESESYKGTVPSEGMQGRAFFMVEWMGDKAFRDDGK